MKRFLDLLEAVHRSRLGQHVLRVFRRTVGRHRYRQDVPDRVRLPTPIRTLYLDTRTAATANFCQNNLKGDVLCYEPAETQVFLEMVEDAVTVFDVGAHVGYYSLLSSVVPSVQTVCAFETLALYAGEIQRHLINNEIDNVTVVRRPVGQEGRVIEFGNFLDLNRQECISLDRFAVGFEQPVDVVKVDVEGAEFEVLLGASDVLRTHRPSLLVAIHPMFLKNKFGASVEDLLGYLAARKYELYRVHSTVGDRASYGTADAHVSVDSLLDPLGVGTFSQYMEDELFTIAAYPIGAVRR